MRAYPDGLATPQEVFAHFLRGGRRDAPTPTSHISAMQGLRDPSAWWTREWIERGCVVYPTACAPEVRKVVRAIARLTRDYQIPVRFAIDGRELTVRHLLRDDLVDVELAAIAQLVHEAARSASVGIRQVDLADPDQLLVWHVERG